MYKVEKRKFQTCRGKQISDRHLHQSSNFFIYLMSTASKGYFQILKLSRNFSQKHPLLAFLHWSLPSKFQAKMQKLLIFIPWYFWSDSLSLTLETFLKFTLGNVQKGSRPIPLYYATSKRYPSIFFFFFEKKIKPGCQDLDS